MPKRSLRMTRLLKLFKPKLDEYELEARDLKLQKENALEASARSNKDLNNYKFKRKVSEEKVELERKVNDL